MQKVWQKLSKGLNCHSYSQLLWNEYDRGYLITHLLVEAEVISPKFWVLPLSSSQIEKYNFQERVKNIKDKLENLNALDIQLKEKS